MRLTPLLAAIFWLLAACSPPVTPLPRPETPAGQAIDAARPTPTLAPTATRQPMTEATAEPSPTTEPTATPEPTATTAAALIADPTRAALADWLANAWRDGRSFADVRASLADSGRLAPVTLAGQLGLPATALPAMAADLNGDGQDEWLFSLVLAESVSSCGEAALGQIWVVNGDGVVLALDVDETGAYWHVPLIVDQADLSGDGLPDIITQSGGCGAHTNYALFHVLSGHGGPIGGVVTAPDTDDPLWRQWAGLERFGVVYAGRTPGIAISFGAHDIVARGVLGPPALLVTGGLFGSAGAGIHRPRTETWLWDGRRLRLAAIEMTRTDERVHRLHDGNLAFALDDLDTAVTRYLEVIQDEGLQDGVAYGESDGGYALARQWAAFRLQLVAWLLEDAIAAAEWAAWPAANYPGAPLTAAADLLAATAPEAGVAAACTAVTEMLAGFESPLGGLADTGYGNPALTIDDLCPIR